MKMSGGDTIATSRRIGMVGQILVLLSSLKLAVVLLLLLAIATLAGTVIPQTPAEVRSDLAAYQDWLLDARTRYGPVTDLFYLLGFFRVFDSYWYWFLAALLGLNMVICTMNRFGGIWRAVWTPRVVVEEKFFDRADACIHFKPTLPSTADVAMVWLRILRREGYRTLKETRGDVIHLYADRNRLARMGTLLVHVGILLVGLGAVAGNFAGFRNPEFIVVEGETRQVGLGTNLALRLEDFSDEYYPTGEPKDYRSQVVILDSGREVQRGIIRVNEPLTYGGVSFHQSFFGYAAYIEVEDDTGRKLFSGSVPLMYRFRDRQSGQFRVQERDLRVILVWTAGMAPGMGDFAVMGYRASSSTPIFNLSLSQGERRTQGDLTFAFHGLREFSGLQVKSSPMLPLVWVGGAMFLLGAVVALYFPHRRLWALCRPTSEGIELVMAGLARRDPGFHNAFMIVGQRVGLDLGCYQDRTG